MTKKTKPLMFLIDAAALYSHQLLAQGIFDHAVTIKLGVELAIEKWGASQKDAKFLRENTPLVPPGAIPPHEIQWKPGRKFGQVVVTIRGPGEQPQPVN